MIRWFPASPFPSNPSPPITWVLPGLFGPITIDPEDAPETPILARCLGGGDRIPDPEGDPLAQIFRQVQVPVPSEADLPSAPLCRLGEGGGVPDTAWFYHADPVHLIPEGDRLWVLDARWRLRPEEVQALVAAFNVHFAREGLHLEAPHPTRWYLQVDGRRPRLRTLPLHRVLGQPIRPPILWGEDRTPWMRRFNEIQMLFHGAPVNERRERAGQPRVNGLWIWGGGTLPAHRPPSAPGGTLYGDHPLIAGLGKALGLPHRSLPRAPESLPQDRAPILIFWTRLWDAVAAGDGVAWCQALREIEDWLARWPRGTRMEIHPCAGDAFEVGIGRWRNRWRRPRSPSQAVLQPARDQDQGPHP